jgi:hypothetical protein
LRLYEIQKTERNAKTHLRFIIVHAVSACRSRCIHRNHDVFILSMELAPRSRSFLLQRFIAEAKKIWLENDISLRIMVPVLAKRAVPGH